MESLMTAQQVADKLGAWCGLETVRKARKDGELAAVRLGTGYGYLERDVEAWVESRREAPTAIKIVARQTARSAARRSR